MHNISAVYIRHTAHATRTLGQWRFQSCQVTWAGDTCGTRGAGGKLMGGKKIRSLPLTVEL